MMFFPRSVLTIASAAVELPARLSSIVRSSSVISASASAWIWVQPLLRGLVLADHPLERLDLFRLPLRGGSIGFEIGFGAGEQIAALAGFGVAHRIQKMRQGKFDVFRLARQIAEFVLRVDGEERGRDKGAKGDQAQDWRADAHEFVQGDAPAPRRQHAEGQEKESHGGMQGEAEQEPDAPSDRPGK